jgi:hypothetical protein
MIKNLWNKKKIWIAIGAVIRLFCGFFSFAIMVIQHSHQVRDIM